MAFSRVWRAAAESEAHVIVVKRLDFGKLGVHLVLVLLGELIQVGNSRIVGVD